MDFLGIAFPEKAVQGNPFGVTINGKATWGRYSNVSRDRAPLCPSPIAHVPSKHLPFAKNTKRAFQFWHETLL